MVLLTQSEIGQETVTLTTQITFHGISNSLSQKRELSSLNQLNQHNCKVCFTIMQGVERIKIGATS